MSPSAEREGWQSESLVARIQAGDRQAEDALVQRFSRGLLVLIRRSCDDRSAVEDLHQETFRIAIAKIRGGQLREPNKLSAFLCAVARNLVIQHGRRKIDLSGTTDLEAIASAAPSQFDEAARRQLADITKAVLAELETERDREILYRFYIAEEPKEGICAGLGLSSLHFNRVLYRARERFRKLYQEKLGPGRDR